MNASSASGCERVAILYTVFYSVQPTELSLAVCRVCPAVALPIVHSLPESVCVYRIIFCSLSFSVLCDWQSCYVMCMFIFNL